MPTRLRIEQTQPADEWTITRIDVDTVETLGVCTTYSEALNVLTASAAYNTLVAAASADQGLLPEWWTSVEGIAFSEPTGDGRDFSACTWISRNPEVSLLPLMLQTETEVGHYGAELAGFIEDLSGLGYRGTPDASGRFYASDCGVQIRDMLQGGRVFGVSVDPGPATEATFDCTETDPVDGFCTDGIYNFSMYEVIGLTATPFPGFQRAAIRLMTATEQATATGEETTEPALAMTVAASVTVGTSTEEQEVIEAAEQVLADVMMAGIPVAPPGEWFTTPEPELGDPRLVNQGRGHLAAPAQIDNNGRFSGHLTYWGQCHIGYDGAKVCVTAPESMAAYAHYHVGDLVTAEGDHLAVGTLFAGTEHADIEWGAAATIDHYAHTGFAWADVRVTNGVFGAWAAGAVRPTLNAAQIRAVRASTLSGDWRRIDGHLEMVAALSVNAGGFPLIRETITASGLMIPDAVQVRSHMVGGVQTALIAAGVVHRCRQCAQREKELAALPAGISDLLARMESQGRLLAMLERRTRHLAGPAAEHALAALNGR
jgi:hypothetical protein